MNFSRASAVAAEFHQQGIIGPFRLFNAAEAPHYERMMRCQFTAGVPTLSTSAHNRHLHEAELLDLIRRPTLTDRVAELVGEDAAIWRTHSWCKEIGGAEIPWHQDWNYWPLEPVVVVSAWIAFNRIERSNACMRVIPGSHRHIVPHITARRGVAFHEEADPSTFDATKAIDVELEAGEFVLFNERLLHGSPVNHGVRDRLGFAVRYIPSLVRVLDYDSSDHVAVPIRDGVVPRFSFTRRDVDRSIVSERNSNLLDIVATRT